MARAPRAQSVAAASEVAAWLRANPRFLAEHPDLYRVLAPPVRVHGEALADHMTAMLHAERTHSAAMAERADGVLAAGRAAAGLAGRVQEAVLALLAAARPEDCIAAEFPALLAVDAASLCIEAIRPASRALPPGTCDRLLRTRGVVFREQGQDSRLLHGEASALARYDALIRLPGEGPPALLALAARDRHVLGPSQGTGALTFLGRAVSVALGR